VNGVDWPIVALGEICDVYDGPHATPKKTASGPIFLGISNLSKGRIDLSGAEHLSEEDFARWTRRVRPRANDVVFSYETKIGEAAIIPENLICCLGRRMGLLRPNRLRVEPRFLLYAYLGPEFQAIISSRTVHGSTVDRIALMELPSFPIQIPSLPEQRAIAHILGTLDDKIELNRRMNETLEAMARALFKSWFVDFDPVRAKVEGRDPGLPPHLAALFPDALWGSEMGEIPKGWRVASVGEGFNLTMGQSPPGETYNEVGEGMPFFQGRTDFGFRFPTQRVYCTAPTRLANPGDTLVSVRAPVGDINMAWEPCCIGRGVAAIRHKTGSRSYTYCMMHSLHDVFADFEAEGTVFGCINKNDFLRIQCIGPTTEVIREFEQQVFPLDEAIQNNSLQSLTLAAIRDALLPKLLSGELHVPDGCQRIRRTD
jgi:type I restriction enzyme S subunit